MRLIFLLGEIAEWGCSPGWMLSQMQGMQPDEPLELHIDSPGGDTFGGFAIANILKTHRGRKTCVIDGECSSAATFAALACDTVQMRPLSMMLVHFPWVSGASGSAEVMDRHVQNLNAMGDMCVELYRAKTGADEATVRAWMATSVYLPPKQAFQMRLCDEVLTDPATPAQARALLQARSQVQAQAQVYYAKLRPPTATSPAPVPKAAAPAPTTRSQHMDRKQQLEALASAMAHAMTMAQQASESADADVAAAATKMLAEGCLPMAMDTIMTLAKAEGMVEENVSAKAKSVLAVYAAVERLTGVKEGHLGALEAMAHNAATKTSTAQASVDVQVEAEIQRGIKSLKILPKAAAGWRSAIAKGDRSVADLRAWIAAALPAAPQASSDPIVGAPVKEDTTAVTDPAVADMLEGI